MYAERVSPRDPIPINVEPFEIRDDVPEDDEIRVAVKSGLKRGKAAGASKLRAEDVKEWLAGVLAEEEHPVSRVGNGDRWRLFIKL